MCCNFYSIARRIQRRKVKDENLNKDRLISNHKGKKNAAPVSLRKIRSFPRTVPRNIHPKNFPLKKIVLKWRSFGITVVSNSPMLVIKMLLNCKNLFQGSRCGANRVA